ncbi:MAG TPA: DUF5615 family PIN-like protein [Phycisphaerae bacterium]|nr:DUF5615 family PIN-like protein [Phycisphaerae bacterium]
MRFLLDNSLSPRMATALCELGHDAIHVRDLDLAEADDPTIFVAAARDQRVLVAQDTDFSAILALRRERQPSVLLFRCRHKSPAGLLRILQANLATIANDLEDGAIVIFDDARIRVRTLPIHGEQ